MNSLDPINKIDLQFFAEGGEGEPGGSIITDPQPGAEGGSGEPGQSQETPPATGGSIITGGTKTNEPKKEPGREPGKESGKEQGKEDKKIEDAPESYQDFTTPKNIALDTDTVTEFKALAKTLNLSQENAQKLVDLQCKLVQKENDLINQRFNKQQEDLRSEVLKQLGPDKDQQLAYVFKARDQFSTPGLNKILADTGFCNHPEFVMFFARIGKALADDKFVAGSKGGDGKRSPAEILYGNDK